MPLLLEAAAANGDSDTFWPRNSDKLDYGMAQCEITGTATVTVYGRLHPSLPFVSIKSWTASGGERVSLFPEMKITVSGLSSGTVSAALVE